jgi:hypothetical protein
MVFGRDWMIARQRFFDAVVIVGDFERAEVEFADVRGGERIFAAAFAALERLHVTVMFIGHKFFSNCHRDTERTEADKNNFSCISKIYGFRLQVLRGQNRAEFSARRHGHRRPERLRQIQRLRRHPLGAGRAIGQGPARRRNGGRDL